MVLTTFASMVTVDSAPPGGTHLYLFMLCAVDKVVEMEA